MRKIDRDDPLEPPPGVLKGVGRDGIDGSVIPGRCGRRRDRPGGASGRFSRHALASPRQCVPHGGTVSRMS